MAGSIAACRGKSPGCCATRSSANSSRSGRLRESRVAVCVGQRMEFDQRLQSGPATLESGTKERRRTGLVAAPHLRFPWGIPARTFWVQPEGEKQKGWKRWPGLSALVKTARQRSRGCCCFKVRGQKHFPHRR